MTDAAEFLADLRLSNRRVEALPSELAPPDLAAAYAVQARLVQRLCERWGASPVGYKIAVTNPAAQRMLGVHHPVVGRLLDARVHRSGTVLRAADYATCLLECEFGFRMASDVADIGRAHDRESVAHHVGDLLPAIELVEHHFAGIDRVTPESLAADNAIHGAWIHGEPATGWRELDLAAVATALVVDGERRLEGSGDRVLGHPLTAVAWLANELAARGQRLRAGDLVTTGVTTDEIHPARAGETVVAELGPLGSVEVSFS